MMEGAPTGGDRVNVRSTNLRRLRDNESHSYENAICAERQAEGFDLQDEDGRGDSREQVRNARSIIRFRAWNAGLRSGSSMCSSPSSNVSPEVMTGGESESRRAELRNELSMRTARFYAAHLIPDEDKRVKKSALLAWLSIAVKTPAANAVARSVTALHGRSGAWKIPSAARHRVHSQRLRRVITAAIARKVSALLRLVFVGWSSFVTKNDFDDINSDKLHHLAASPHIAGDVAAGVDPSRRLNPSRCGSLAEDPFVGNSEELTAAHEVEASTAEDHRQDGGGTTTAWSSKDSDGDSSEDFEAGSFAVVSTSSGAGPRGGSVCAFNGVALTSAADNVNADASRNFFADVGASLLCSSSLDRREHGNWLAVASPCSVNESIGKAEQVRLLKLTDSAKVREDLALLCLVVACWCGLTDKARCICGVLDLCSVSAAARRGRGLAKLVLAVWQDVWVHGLEAKSIGEDLVCVNKQLQSGPRSSSRAWVLEQSFLALLSDGDRVTLQLTFGAWRFRRPTMLVATAQELLRVRLQLEQLRERAIHCESDVLKLRGMLKARELVVLPVPQKISAAGTWGDGAGDAAGGPVAQPLAWVSSQADEERLPNFPDVAKFREDVIEPSRADHDKTLAAREDQLLRMCAMAFAASDLDIVSAFFTIWAKALNELKLRGGMLHKSVAMLGSSNDRVAARVAFHAWKCGGRASRELAMVRLQLEQVRERAHQLEYEFHTLQQFAQEREAIHVEVMCALNDAQHRLEVIDRSQFESVMFQLQQEQRRNTALRSHIDEISAANVVVSRARRNSLEREAHVDAEVQAGTALDTAHAEVQANIALVTVEAEVQANVVLGVAEVELQTSIELNSVDADSQANAAYATEEAAIQTEAVLVTAEAEVQAEVAPAATEAEVQAGAYLTTSEAEVQVDIAVATAGAAVQAVAVLISAEAQVEGDIALSTVEAEVQADHTEVTTEAEVQVDMAMPTAEAEVQAGTALASVDVEAQADISLATADMDVQVCIAVPTAEVNVQAGIAFATVDFAVQANTVAADTEVQTDIAVVTDEERLEVVAVLAAAEAVVQAFTELATADVEVQADIVLATEEAEVQTDIAVATTEAEVQAQADVVTTAHSAIEAEIMPALAGTKFHADIVLATAEAEAQTDTVFVFAESEGLTDVAVTTAEVEVQADIAQEYAEAEALCFTSAEAFVDSDKASHVASIFARLDKHGDGTVPLHELLEVLHEVGLCAEDLGLDDESLAPGTEVNYEEFIMWAFGNEFDTEAKPPLMGFFGPAPSKMVQV
eukprot:TRINITY_DN42635_c0_g1_i1.p1 TRINITY_DN42635_c0_g1~~TRINITY_DN42635_c0_g1_i1.p1  ORF type:complete len:1284 (-),score=266.66 TRINITY_DN42635_c0_g1_i1:243-4094(-)